MSDADYSPEVPVAADVFGVRAAQSLPSAFGCLFGFVSVRVEAGARAPSRRSSRACSCAGENAPEEQPPQVGRQREGGSNTTWFIAFAPSDHPTIAMAQYMEQSGGYSATVAAPVA